MQTAPAPHLLQAAGNKVAELLGGLVLIQLGRLLLNNQVEKVPEAQLGLEPWPCSALHTTGGGACQPQPGVTAAAQRSNNCHPPPRRPAVRSEMHCFEQMASCTSRVHPPFLGLEGEGAQGAVHAAMAASAA